MISRIAFVLVAIFWLAMNILLWRSEYGSQNRDLEVPLMLVWKKILTAPDASLLTVYENGERMGFCELSTSVEQAMADLDEGKLPPEGLVKHAGYKLRVNGNISFGDLTNRVKFNGQILFSSLQQWHEIRLKLIARNIVTEIFSVATNEMIHLKITGPDVSSDISFSISEVNNPSSLLKTVSRSFGAGDWLGGDEFSLLGRSAVTVKWNAYRERLMIGRDPVTAFRLETRFLENRIVIHVSTLGEILKVELPNGIVARLEEWSKS